MANSLEKNSPAVTASEAVRNLFARLPLPDKDLVWLADELISIVQHIGSVSLELVRDNSETPLLIARNMPTDGSVTIEGSGPTRLFRPLLARLAVIGAEETGTEFQPYGGCYTLIRSSRSGPVRLDIQFTNTTTSQNLSISRVQNPVARPKVTSNTVESQESLTQHNDS
jgi:hypothetical protein